METNEKNQTTSTESQYQAATSTKCQYQAVSKPKVKANDGFRATEWGHIATEGFQS